VAGVVAGPQLEVGLEVVVAARGAVVGTHGDGHDAVLARAAPDGGREPGGHPVRGDDDRCAVVDDLPRGATLVVEALRGDAGDPPGGVPQRSGDVGALVQGGAPALGVPCELLVELGPGADHAVRGEGVGLRPVELEGVPAAADAQSLGALPPGGVDPERDELPGGAGGEPVAADLVAGERRLLEQHDVEPVVGEVRRGGAAAGPGTDDDDVGPFRPGRRGGPLRGARGLAQDRCLGVLVNVFTIEVESRPRARRAGTEGA
jgi:hypothetical protein